MQTDSKTSFEVW